MLTIGKFSSLKIFQTIYLISSLKQNLLYSQSSTVTDFIVWFQDILKNLSVTNIEDVREEEIMYYAPIVIESLY